MSIFLKKAWEKVKKYWQIFLGLFVGLFFAVKYAWQLRAQKKMLKNEIEKVEKINKVEKEFSDKIVSVTETATKEHDDRVKIVNDELNDNSEKVKKEFDERIKENKVGTNEDLANKIGDTFDVNVVLPEEKDEE